MPRIYGIFPPIGIARVGEDTDFILGAEVPGKGPTEPTAGDAVVRFKNAAKTQVRKQAARFRVFESDDGFAWRPITLPPGAKVVWRVALANKKAAVIRSGQPPITPARPVVPPANQGLVINGGVATVSGPNDASPPLKGDFNAVGAGGSPYRVSVELGQLRTDAAGNLIVLGGNGFSSAPPNTPLGTSYYRNPNWHDDVSDGPVSAEIQIPDQASIKIDRGAWVIVTPPDYAPAIDGIVTMYDVLRQVGIDKGELSAPATPSFDRDVAPLIVRARRLQWVHDNANWSSATLLAPNLRSRTATAQPARAAARETIKNVEGILKGHVDPAGPPYLLRKFQNDILDAWVNGDFDETAMPPIDTISAEGLTQAALEAAVGQGFCPGIEAGILFTEPTLYAMPFDFRLDTRQLEPGDITALMAQPWQADFLKCNTEWWPSQRPDIAFQHDDTSSPWARGIATHLDLVKNSARLGFIVKNGADEVFLEAERDPTWAIS